MYHEKSDGHKIGKKDHLKQKFSPEYTANSITKLFFQVYCNNNMELLSSKGLDDLDHSNGKIGDDVYMYMQKIMMKMMILR